MMPLKEKEILLCLFISCYIVNFEGTHILTSDTDSDMRRQRNSTFYEHCEDYVSDHLSV